MRRLLAVSLLCLLLAGCTRGDWDATSGEFAVHRTDMVGSWRMDTYVQDEGERHEFWDYNVVFTYEADGTGVKTVDGETEYTLTFSYNGEQLYTTASYPSGKVQLMSDACTIEKDSMTIYSYDEKATIVLRRVDTVKTTS